MQALARDGFKPCDVGLLIVPGSVRRTGFHGREDMHQSGVIASLSDNRLDALLLAKGLIAPDEFDVQTGLLGERLGMLAQLIAQRFGPVGIVKQTHLTGAEITCHRLGISDLRQGSGDDHAVKAREYASDLIVMAFDKWVHCHPLSRAASIPVPMAVSHGRERPTLMATQCLEWKRCQGGVQGGKLLDSAGT